MTEFYLIVFVVLLFGFLLGRISKKDVPELPEWRQPTAKQRRLQESFHVESSHQIIYVHRARLQMRSCFYCGSNECRQVASAELELSMCMQCGWLYSLQ